MSPPDLRVLLASAPVRPIVAADVRELVRALVEWLPGDAPPIQQAVLSGFVADRLGFAFVGGYRAALSALVPELESAALVTFAATEERGAHPRAIDTHLDRSGDGTLVLTGEKRWSTLAPLAQAALVVAKEGADESGRPRLRLVKVSLEQASVSVEPMPPTPFAPEVPHAVVRFESVRVQHADVLPGDGYDRYLKPFRTLEDLHVHAALVGYLVSLARRAGGHRDVVERCLAICSCLEELARAEPRDPGLHLALAGVLRETESLVSSAKPCLTDVPRDEAERFERDLPLLGVASRARAARTDRAWARLESGTG